MIHNTAIEKMMRAKVSDPVPPEVTQILRDFAANGDNGQVILNLNRGAIESYKTVRYVRVIDKEKGSKRQ